ncbi:MAG: hypothetical protein M0Z53_11185 [Thermaerobacter sp.]|nr:hypothetical protein [Thermaerobacter sp.]
MIPPHKIFEALQATVKTVILPQLHDELAREQAIAMIPILKYLDATLTDRQQTEARQNACSLAVLKDLARAMGEDPSDLVSGTWGNMLKRQIAEIDGASASPRHKWMDINQLVGDWLVRLETAADPMPQVNGYREILRGLIRQQLDIAMKTVF